MNIYIGISWISTTQQTSLYVFCWVSKIRHVVCWCVDLEIYDDTRCALTWFDLRFNMVNPSWNRDRLPVHDFIQYIFTDPRSCSQRPTSLPFLGTPLCRFAAAWLLSKGVTPILHNEFDMVFQSPALKYVSCVAVWPCFPVSGQNWKESNIWLLFFETLCSNFHIYLALLTVILDFPERKSTILESIGPKKWGFP